MEAETFRPTHRKTQRNQTPKGNMGNLQLVLTVLLLTPSLAKFWCRRFSQKPYLGWLTMGATRSNSCARDWSTAMLHLPQKFLLAGREAQELFEIFKSLQLRRNKVLYRGTSQMTSLLWQRKWVGGINSSLQTLEQELQEGRYHSSFLLGTRQLEMNWNGRKQGTQ